MRTAEPAVDGYVNLRRGRLYLGVSAYRFLQLTSIYGIGVVAELGRPARYRWADVERVRAELDAARGRTISPATEAVA
jgi:hypothetical protein